MTEQIDQQRLNDYRNKVANWIGRQGILCQLRYAKTLGPGAMTKPLAGLLIRIVILVLILALVGLFLLKHHFSSSTYREEITGQLEEALGAESVDPDGFTRNSTSGKYKGLEIKGGDQSFFYEARLQELSGEFSLLTGISEDWKPKSVAIQKADFQIKAGGSLEEMVASYASIRGSLTGNGLDLIKIDDLSFDWGYSKLTHGAVRNTSFNAKLEGGVWKIEIRGGTFEQNWLGPLTIKKGVLRVGESGLEVVSLSLALGGGSLELSGGITGPLDMPQFDLKGAFSSLPLEKLIVLEGITTREFIEGTISGDLQISGSSNRRIETSVSVELVEDDLITIRERWSLLRALSILDSDRTYLRLAFSTGSFSFTTGGGAMVLKDVDLVSPESAKLLGNLTTSLPTQEEAAEALGIVLTSGFTKRLTDKSSAMKLENERMSLKNRDDAPPESVGVDINGSVESGIKKVDEKLLSPEQLEELRLQSEMDVHRIDGELRLAVPASAFDDNENLAKLYPGDEEGWSWIPIALKDTKLPAISEEANQKLLDEGRARRGITEDDDN